MRARRGGEFWAGMLLGVALLAGWLAMLAYNAIPYLQGAAARPPLLTLLAQLVTPPALASVIAPSLATLAGWSLAALILAMAATMIVSAVRLPARARPHPAFGPFPSRGWPMAR